MTRRDSFLRCTVTLLVVVLLGVIGAALACAPSAPSGQDETPSPTATPTPAPPPTPGTSLDDLPGLDPLLSARVAEYEAAQLSVQGASGQSTAPKMVDIYIGASTGKSRKEILQLLADHGATSVRTHGVTNIYAKVPASLLRTLSERTDIDSMKADPLPYPKIDAGLNGLAVRYAAGLMPDEDTNPTYGRLLIGFNNDATDAQYEAVKRYLLAGGSVMGHDDTIMEEAYKPFLIVAYVPVKLFAGLDSMPGVAEVDQEWPYPIPAEFRITIQDDPPTSENRSGDEATAGAGDTSHAPITPPTPLAPTRTGGAVAHGADAWQAAGYKGQGVKIGIIDVGYDGYSALVPGELPSPSGESCYRPLNKCLFGNLRFIDNHGTAVAEAVADIAPQSSLYLEAPVYEGEFQMAVRWLSKTIGVDVIVQSLAWHYDGPGDGAAPQALSIIKNASDAVNNDDVIWINAAGNEASRTWFSTSDQYSNDTASGAFPRTRDFINFNAAAGLSTAPGATAPAHCNRTNLPDSGVYYFHLRWADQWSNAATDLDLYLTSTSSTNEIKIGVVNSDFDNRYPVESFKVHTFPRSKFLRPSTIIPNLLIPGQRVNGGEYCVRVRHRGGPEPAWIQLQVFGESRTAEAGPLKYSTASRSIVSPAESSNPGVLAVGAANVAANPATLPSAVAASSSRGPLPGANDIVKPDIVGVAGTHSTARGGAFSGTSQAAPHVAGLAALFRERFPDYSAELVAHFLKSNAVQRGSPDPNNTWGHGFAKLPSPAAQPGMPSGVSGVGGDQRVTLTWNDAANATGYQVSQWDGRNNRWRTLPFRERKDSYDRTYTYTLDGAGATVGNLVNGVTYAHRVRSSNGNLLSPWTALNASAHTAAVSPLPTPTGLRGVGRNGSASLYWNPVAGATGYEVQQWNGAELSFQTLPFRERGFSHDYGISFSGSEATVTGLTNGVGYAHRVRAVQGGVSSAWSDWIATRLPAGGGSDSEESRPPNQPDATPTPAPSSSPGLPPATPAPPSSAVKPSGLSAAVENGQVVLSWTEGTNTRYVQQRVKRRAAKGDPAPWTYFSVGLEANTYTDATAVSDTKYIYRVEAVKSSGKTDVTNRVVVLAP